ncbi:MAG: hypothetical protein WA771_12760 [Chthoniobacterales bacterium]
MRIVTSVLSLLVLIAALLGSLTANRSQVFVGGDIYFVDADCYSRMTRVQQVISQPFRRIAQHNFENFPTGTSPHTTAPFDLVIAGLAASITPFATNAIDLAGAWVSPVIALTLLTFLWCWMGRERIPFRFATLFLIAISPPVVQAFKLGRPDHQSLTLALVTAGFVAEIMLRQRPSRPWIIAWGLLWGCALWVTLYEPLILLGIVLVSRFLSPQTTSSSRRGMTVAALIAAAAFLAGVLFDGWRIGPPPPEVGEYFPRWSTLLGELNSVPPFSGAWLTWFGYLLPAIIPLAIWTSLQSHESKSALIEQSILLISLTVATYGLTIWQVRWSPFFIIPAALLLPAALSAIPSRVAASVIYALSLWPLASDWDARLFPDQTQRSALAEQRTENVLLRQTSSALRSDTITPVLAPWWLCPAIAYWSGQPCVGGSSHQSLPGIVDTSRFYLARTLVEADEIITKREVKAVVAYEPDRLISTSATLLDRPPSSNVLATSIYRNPRALPGFTQTYANPYFRLFSKTSPPMEPSKEDGATAPATHHH